MFSFYEICQSRQSIISISSRFQTDYSNQQKKLNNACVIIRKHLLKFNIKPDLEIIRFFLPDNKEELDSQKFQKALKIAIQIFNIRNFYGYSCIEKLSIMPYYLTFLEYLCSSRLLKKNFSKVEKFVENIFKKYPLTHQTVVLRQIYCGYRAIWIKRKVIFYQKIWL